MDRAELQAFAARYVETWQRRNPTALAQYHAADGVVESPMYQTRRGRVAIEEAYRAFFTSFPDATTEVEALVIGREVHSITNVKVEPRQRDFLLTNGCLPNDERSRLFAAGLGFSSSL